MDKKREDYIEELRQKVGGRWPALLKARENAWRTKGDLEQLLVKGEDKFTSGDTNIVVFGSLGRNEWTSGSDLDWTFLVDGQADPQHLDMFLEIQKRLKGYKEPGRTGIFGNMAFSHDIIHRIGGQRDTNENMTRRVLLLLESDAIGRAESDAYTRVIKQILNRYLEEEARLRTDDGKHYKVPRFFLNDIVRFWRTMAVDFASKQREQGGQKWGLRNAKLRMSRKLIFAAGLLTCFSCHGLAAPGDDKSSPEESDDYDPLLIRLLDYISLTPLDILAKELVSRNVANETSKQIFEAYEEFLCMLDDKGIREKLEKEVTPENCRKSEVFRRIRNIGEIFQGGLDKLFYSDRLIELTKKYAIF